MMGQKAFMVQHESFLLFLTQYSNHNFFSKGILLKKQVYIHDGGINIISVKKPITRRQNNTRSVY